MTPLSLQEYLSREIGYDAERMDGTPDPALARLITGISEACKEISAKVREGALAGVLGLAGSENVQGEDQKKLDIISNDIFVEAVSRAGRIAKIEPMETLMSILLEPSSGSKQAR